ncbi:MAG: discoidin domain-containing protein [Deltaproteobacteria bacterium]|nr:discoidin domain-containing protein [Deltaproteobacteria bacterium]
MIRSVFVLLLSLLLACGDDDAPAESPATEAPPPESEAPTAEAETPTEPEAPEDLGDPVDLLTAAPTAVAVSSAYHDRDTQVPRLFDGDMETAWNSRSDDLVGAWIEVRLPAEARVSGIALTSGFTKPGGDTDLFTGNQRVKKVRILRNGEEVAVHDLDVDSRELQPLAVEGDGGIWRIEIAEVLQGTKENWKEICVSELMVMGHLEGAEPDTRFPRFAVGALPAEPPAVNREEVLGQLRLKTHQMVTAWLKHEDDMLLLEEGQPEGWDEFDLEEFRSSRRHALQRVVDLSDPIVPEADRVRRQLYLSPDGSWDAFAPDFEPVAVAMAALMEWADRDEDRCRWAKAHAQIRLERVEAMLSATSAQDSDFESENLDAIVTITEHTQGFSADSRTVTTRLLRMPEAPVASFVASDWSAMREQLALAQRTCGWE